MGNQNEEEKNLSDEKVTQENKISGIGDFDENQIA